MIIALSIAGAVYLAIGLMAYLVAALKFQGNPESAYIERLGVWARSGGIGAGLVAAWLVLVWPLHLIVGAVAK